MPHIYIIKNIINNKCYVGQTINSIEYRFKQHKGQVNCKNQCSALYSAFKKYGAENFYIESLLSGSFSKEELNKLEVSYIKKYNTLSPNGYNLQTGGRSFKVSKESREKISKALKGREVNWNDKISDGVKKLWENEEYRKNQTKQRHTKRGKYRNGIVRLNKRKSVDIISFKKDYNSYMNLSEMSKKYNISINTMYDIIKREKIQKRGYRCNQKKH